MSTPSCCGGRRGWIGALLPGVIAVLLPKCPLCLAGYLAVVTGTGLAAPFASTLQPTLWGLSGAMLLWVVWRR